MFFVKLTAEVHWFSYNPTVDVGNFDFVSIVCFYKKRTSFDMRIIQFDFNTMVT